MICTLLLASALTLNLKEIPLLDAIDIVRHKAGINVAIAPEVLAASMDLPAVTLNARETKGDDILNALLAGGGLKLEDENGVNFIRFDNAPRVSTLTVPREKRQHPLTAAPKSEPQLAPAVASTEKPQRIALSSSSFLHIAFHQR